MNWMKRAIPARKAKAVRRTAMRSAVAGVVASAAVTALGGCTLTPDRESEARELTEAVETMPGVYDVSNIYSNDFTAGVLVSLRVKMHKDASPEQTEAVAQRIAHSYRTDFPGHNRDMRLQVAGGFFEHHTGTRNTDNLSHESISTDLRTLWQIGAAMPTPRLVSWKRSHSQAELDVGDATDESVFQAVRSVLGDRPVRVLATTGGTPPLQPVELPSNDSFPDLRARNLPTRWQIDLPLSPADEARARESVERSQLKVGKVALSGGHIDEMLVYTWSPPQAHDDLSVLIENTAATAAHPLLLRWEYPTRPRPDLEFKGSIHVAGCDYVDTFGEENPQDYYTPEAIALQQQLRSEYDTCPK
ncbi:hypothetical protein HGA13_18420 [Nocardia speluncae]|uniref:Uncharacterized protein n=1 Tax=Nocardia speluncae TaxID=419477 RepID=A0A846XGC9_9NOCA|nr:hypothetical protein [Nocardia speluncae]NKY35032.1 hypothetical protein [Nocardia speluncae]